VAATGLTDIATQPASTARPSRLAGAQARRDLQRTCRLVLASVWLLDAVLQLQPFMFTPGPKGFSGMLTSMSAGNPGWVARSIAWNASIVAHQPVLTNTAFALVQFMIAFGLAFRRTCKAALGLSIAWSLGVWWFGEGLGMMLQGRATPFGGGPGGVLFYALLAVLLWPSDGSDLPFVAARTVGVRAARAVWGGVWCLLAVLSVVGAGREPVALSALVTGVEAGEPGWLAHLDAYTSTLMSHDGTGLAIALAAFCVVVGAAVYLPPPAVRVAIVAAVAVFAFIWVGVQNFGGILAGGATDPNSGLLVILFAVLYWPLDEDAYQARELRLATSQAVNSCH
jgi:hypothetical protein